MIYFLQEEDGGPVKIGYVREGLGLASRICDEQCGNWRKLVVRHTEPGDQAAETALHRQYAHLHVRGEWFTPLDGLAERARAIPATGRRSSTTPAVVEAASTEAPSATLHLPPELVDYIARRVLAIAQAERALEEDGWVRGADAAAGYLGCPRSRIYDLVSQRRLEPVRDGRVLCFRRTQLDTYLLGA